MQLLLVAIYVLENPHKNILAFFLIFDLRKVSY